MKVCPLMIILLLCQNVFSQSNTFPTSGNAGIGTTSPQYPLEVNGPVSLDGLLISKGNGSLVNNLGIGMGTLSNATTGYKNLAIGLNSLNQNTTAVENVAIGEDVMRFNTTGTENTAVGVWNLRENSTGSGNTAIGNYVAFHQTTGNNNTAIGKNAMEGLRTGSYNTGVGLQALSGNGYGIYNTAIGVAAGASASGNFNTCIGARIRGNSGESNLVVIGDGEETPNSIRFYSPASGNVLFGSTTDNGVDKLQVNGTILSSASEEREVQTYLPNNYTTGDIVSGHAYKWYNDIWRIGNIRSGAMPTDGFGVSLNNEIKLKVTPLGNVGIGTAAPDEKLTVKGKIHAEEIKVDLIVPGPDYVFEKNYYLQPLSEIQEYVQVNKRLPEVPSAKEMEKNGINLSEMNMLLLKKIEELTLHLIDKGKQIDYLMRKDKENIFLINELKQLVTEVKNRK